MADAHKNFAYSAVATAPSPAASGTSLVVTSGHGTRFPAPPFNAVVCPAGIAPTPENAEIVRVTAVTGETFTIVRTQEGTSARTIGVGDAIFAGPTAKTFTDVEALGTKTLAVFTPLHNQPPATNFATFDTRNSIAVLDFDDTVEESAVFVFIIPEGANLSSGVKIRIHWTATSATSGTCYWSAQLEKTHDDIDSDSFATADDNPQAADATSGLPQVSEIIISTNLDGLVAGNLCRLKVIRKAANGGDTMVGDAELIAVEVRSVA